MFVTFNKLVSDFDIHVYKPNSRDCKDSKIYPAAGHVVTGNLKIIPDSRMRNIVSNGPKYRFPSHIYFNRYREDIASALNDCCWLFQTNQGVPFRIVFVGIFFVFNEIIILCFVVALCGPVHDVDAMFHLPKRRTASGNLV